MPQKLTEPKYFKYSELDPNTPLVTKGEFVGITQGKFGDQYNFIEVDTGQHVVLNKAGAFEWRVEQGHMKEGEVFDIIFLGKETLGRGPYAGKDVNKFDIAKYGEHELPEKFAKKSAPTVAGGSVSPKAVGQAEALDDLD